MLYSTEHQVSPPFPTCLDYTRQQNSKSTVLSLTGEVNRFFPRSIGEDESTGRAHVLHLTASRVVVISYEGCQLFTYPLKGALPHGFFKPRGISISDNLIFISDLRNRMLFMFTLEGDLVSYSTCEDIYYPEARLDRPRGLAADKDNNVYICQGSLLKAYSPTLPVHQTFGNLQIGRPKDVRLYLDLILVLSWTTAASIFTLTTYGAVLRETQLGDQTRPARPWYFDLDHHGNILIMYSKDSKLETYSQDGNLVASTRVTVVERGRAVKLLRNKTLVAVTGYGQNSLVIF